MDDIRISTRGGRTHYSPGESIEGIAGWNLRSAPQTVEIRLLWQTRGKGTEDASIVESETVAHPAAMGDASFRFTLPDAPYSFAGQLIALVWAIEVVAVGARNKQIQNELFEFEMSPFESAIVLPKIEKPMTPLEAKMKERVFGYAKKRGLDPNTYRK